MSTLKIKEVHICVGLPGSGKSTYLRNLLAGRPHTILNADMIREELTGDATCQDKNDEVFSLHHKRYKEFLLSSAPEHQVIGIDNTSITSSVRKQYHKFATEVGVEVKFFIYMLYTDLAESKKRNKSRTRVVPDYVIEDMHARMTVPTQEEINKFGINTEFIHVHPSWIKPPIKLAFIGDIHGSINQLNKLLGYLGFWKDNGKWCTAGAYDIVLLGDLNDYRHPETLAQSSSIECIRTAMELDKAGLAKVMQSNHQNKLIRYLKGNKIVISHGLDNTIKEFNTISSAEKSAILEWLDELSYWDLLLDSDGKVYAASHAYFADWFAKEYDRKNPWPKKVRDLCMYGVGTQKTSFDSEKYESFEEMQKVEGSHTRHNFWETECYLDKIKSVDKVIVGHYHIVYQSDKITIIDSECGKGGDLLAYIPSEDKLIAASL